MSITSARPVILHKDLTFKTLLTSVQGLTGDSNNLNGFFMDGLGWNTSNVVAYSQALAGASTTQQQLVMSTMGLSDAQKAQVEQTMLGITSTAELTAAEVAMGVAKLTGIDTTDKKRMAELEATIVENLETDATDRLTIAQFLAANAMGKVSDEALAEVIAVYAANNAMDKLKKTSLSFSDSMKLMFSNQPIMMILSIISVLATLFSLLKNNTDLFASAAEKAETAREAYDNVCDQLDELNDEYDTNAERLKELQELADAGTITIVEQEELDNLETSNALLNEKKEAAYGAPLLLEDCVRAAPGAVMAAAAGGGARSGFRRQMEVTALFAEPLQGLMKFLFLVPGRLTGAAGSAVSAYVGVLWVCPARGRVGVCAAVGAVPAAAHLVGDNRPNQEKHDDR